MIAHAAFSDCVLLSANLNVTWAEVTTWSRARREAALIVLGESKGGKFNRRTWKMEWPKP